MLGKTWRIIAIVILGIAGIFTAVAIAGNGPKGGHISICHHTGRSQAHEWVYISPAASGVVNGHGKVNHNYAEDIIPAFTYQSKKGTVNFSGRNLNTRYDSSLEPTANGQFTGSQILAAHCQKPSSSGGTTTNGTTTVKTTPVTTTVTVTSPGQTTTTVKKVHVPAKPVKKPPTGTEPFTG